MRQIQLKREFAMLFHRGVNSNTENLRNPILKNFFSLSALNIFSIALPLLSVPYLLSTLGTAGYGRAAFYQYLGSFMLVLFEFGFPMYAVTEVAKVNDDKSKLGQLLSSIYTIKFYIVAFGIFLSLLIFAIFKNRLDSHADIALLLSFACNSLLVSLYPTWLFQGLNRIHETVIPIFIGRLIGLIATFSIIRNPSDVKLVALPYLLGSAITLVWLGYRSFSHFKLGRYSSCTQLLQIFFGSLQIFWSRLTIIGYVTLSPLLVNSAAGPEGVAVYNLCEKLIAVARLPFDAFSSAVFARASAAYQTLNVRRMLIWLGTGGGIAMILMTAILPFAVSLSHLDIPGLSIYLSIYAIAIIPISMHGFLGTCVLLSNSRRNQLTISIVWGAIAYLCTTAILWRWVDNKTMIAIVSMIMVECAIFLSRLLSSIKFRLL